MAATAPKTPAKTRTTVRTTTSARPTAAAKAETSGLPVPISSVPGPRLYRLVRVALVVMTLLSTTVCAWSILASESQQESSATSVVHAQDLRDLRSQSAQAQAEALASLLDPQGSDGAALWSAYQYSSAQADSLLLVSAASADDPEDLADVATGLRNWQQTLAVVHSAAASGTVDPHEALAVADAFAVVDQAVADTSTASAADRADGNIFTVIGIVVSVLACLGFIAASVVVARRSHRVVNIGLAVGLLAVIGSAVVTGIYAAQSSQVSQQDSYVADLSRAETSVWNALAASAMSVLDQASWQSHTDDADDLVAQASDVAGTTGLADRQAQISGTSDSAARARLVLDSTPWQDTASSLRSTIDELAPAPASLVVPAAPAASLVAGLGAVAVAGTLIGIYARAKEYA